VLLSFDLIFPFGQAMVLFFTAYLIDSKPYFFAGENHIAANDKKCFLDHSGRR